MKWKVPPKIKVYEALGSIADDRIEVDGNTAKVYSTDGSKYYDVIYDSKSNSIMTNDNGSYWVGYLGYPAIAFLMLKGLIKYDKSDSETFRGIEWKKINTKFKNNFDKTIDYIFSEIIKDSDNQQKISANADIILEEITNLDLNLLGTKQKPPVEKH